MPGLSENVRVRSILGRFLEHSRIYAFANAAGPAIGEGPESGPEVYIGSADLMHRNLDRRVEALVRIADEGQVAELLELMDASMSDETSTWHLQPDDTWVRHAVGRDGVPLVDLQAQLVDRHRRRPERAR